MRILLVEDNRDFAGTLEKAISRIDGCELAWKRSKAGAKAALAEESFDVVILDRRIPTEDDFLDDHADHGWDVFQSIRQDHSGTSVWFLTGTVDADFATELLHLHGTKADVHGRDEPEAVYRVYWKDKMVDCVTAIGHFRAQVALTSNIHVEQVGPPVNLRAEELWMLKLFTRRRGGATAQITALTGGLSGARVLRVSVLNAAGTTILSSIARVGPASEIEKERAKYHSEIIRLEAGSFPQVTYEIAYGAGAFAAIFYGIVGSEVRSLFDELASNPAGTADIPARLRADQANWFAARSDLIGKVSSIRRSQIGDVKLASLDKSLFEGLDFEGVEDLSIQFSKCVQHSDLHCANVLLDNVGRPMFIDYLDTGLAPACLDAIALELSTIFHKDAPDRHGWPSEEQAEQWTDIDAFGAGAAYEAYLRGCRAWAVDVAGTEQAVWATAYAYAVRQLRYPDTDKTIARAIIRSCIARLKEWASSDAQAQS